MRTIKKLALTVSLVGGGLLFAPQAASAQTCIQEVWQAHGNTQSLTCTANDVTLSSATNINITNGGFCDPITGACECFAGQTVTFTADFQMDLTAAIRYDVGFYIATDGDPNNDGAITGQCTATASLAGNTPVGNFINLDAAPDVCGDIAGPFNTAHNPLFVEATITAQCPVTPGEQLTLPFATTWRQPGSNEVCLGTGNGTTTNDVFPGSPSKCNVGTLVLDIVSRPTDVTVTKEALTASVPETGGSATYSVTVTNNSTALPVTLTSMVDAPFGDITQVQGAVTATTCVPDLSAATCEVGGQIAAGGSCSCTFTATVPPGDFPGSFPDVVTVCGNNPSDPTIVCRSDDAIVPYSDVPQPPSLMKTASNAQCQIDVTYDVVVTNGSPQDTLTLNTLIDDVYGNITLVQGNVLSTTCAAPQTIAAAGNYACSFVARINSCNTSVTDIVSGTATDNDGRDYNPTTDPPFPPDSATVIVTVIRQ